MTTIDQLHEDENFLSAWTFAHPNSERAKKALLEVRQEIFVRENRDLFPVEGEMFFVVGPGGKIFRCEKER